MQTFLTILLSLTLGWGCSHLARQRGRSPLKWFAAGLFFGILALALLLILSVPRRREVSPSQIAISQNHPKLVLLFSSHEQKLWYFLDEKKVQTGPMSFDALSKAWNEGKVRENTYVWNETMENWQKFQEVIKPLYS